MEITLNKLKDENVKYTKVNNDLQIQNLEISSEMKDLKQLIKQQEAYYNDIF